MNKPTVKLLTEDNEQAYRQFIELSPAGSLYHTLEWRSVIQTTYQYKPYYFIALQDERVIGALPLFQVNTLLGGRRLISLPFSHQVPVLYTEPPVFHQLVIAAQELTEKINAKYLEIKHGGPLPKQAHLVASENFYNSILNLEPDIESLWESFDGRIRRAVRKAKRNNINLEIDDTLDKIEVFYKLEVETRKRQGSPPYAFKLFDSLRRFFAGTGKVRLYLALSDRRPVAGIIMMYHNDLAIYAYGASVNDREILNLRPNNLLFWEAIRDAKAAGHRVFDFGTTHPANTGLLFFKAGWGGSSEMISYYYYLHSVDSIPTFDRESAKFRIASSMLRKMPVALLERIGPILLKQLG